MLEENRPTIVNLPWGLLYYQRLLRFGMEPLYVMMNGRSPTHHIRQSVTHIPRLGDGALTDVAALTAGGPPLRTLSSSRRQGRRPRRLVPIASSSLSHARVALTGRTGHAEEEGGPQLR